MMAAVASDVLRTTSYAVDRLLPQSRGRMRSDVPDGRHILNIPVLRSASCRP